MTKLTNLRERLKKITDEITIIVDGLGEFKNPNTEILLSRFTYVSTDVEHETKLLLSFRTKVSEDRYEYSTVHIDNNSEGIELLHNGKYIVEQIKDCICFNKDNLKMIAEEMNEINHYITQLISKNIKLQQGKYFRYSSLSIGYSSDENCISLKLMEKINNKPTRHFIKLIEKDGDIKFRSNPLYKQMIPNINQVMDLVSVAIR